MGSGESKEPRLTGLMTLKVAAKSNPSTVAGAIANNVRDGKSVEIVAMGPESINNTVKAIEKKSAIKFFLNIEKTSK